MKQFEEQYYGQHDDLDIEYESLWSNADIILQELENHFEDAFYAKVFLSRIFMVSILVFIAQLCIFSLHKRRAMKRANDSWRI